MKIKRIKAKAVKRCNLCGKKFELWDAEENFCFRHRFGYGSAYDGYLLNLNLCCKCFDRLMDELVPKCKTNPLPDPYAELAAAYAEDFRAENEAGESKGAVNGAFAGHIGRQCRPKTPCLSRSSPL